MPARRLKRYIAYNVGLWMAVALLGALVLMGVRQYGHAVMARQTARGLLDGARAAVDRGSLYDAQRAIRAALAAYPPISPEIAAKFAPSMTGMPLVREQMRQLDRSGAAPLGEEGRLVLSMAEGGFSKELLSAKPAPAAGELNLWLGRTMLARGDVLGAAQSFRVFWNREGARRAEMAAKLQVKNPRKGQDEYAAGKRLVFNGLIPEALAAFDRAKAAGYENADTIFWRGAAQEMEGKRDAAKACYTAALKRLPNHRLALIRMKTLE